MSIKKEDNSETRMNAGTVEGIIKSQSEYKGNSQLDRVTVKVTKAGSHVKKGKEYSVHPTTALIWQQKGLIDDSWARNVKTYNRSENGTSLQENQVTKPQV